MAAVAVVTWLVAAPGLAAARPARGATGTGRPPATGSWRAGRTGTWRAPATVDPPQGDLTAVSCASASFCVAVDAHGNALTYDGTSWSRPAPVDLDGGGFLSVSCPSSAFCVAVDRDGRAVRLNGSAWTAPSAVDPHGGGLNSATCTSPTFCLAVDAHGNALRFDGTTWTAPTAIDRDGGGLNSAICTSPTFCLAVDAHGNALRFDGTTWTAPTPVDPDGGGLAAVSCGSATSCVAVDTSDSEDNQPGHNGNAVIFNGSSWSAPTSVDPYGGGFYSLSCATPTFCLALDTEGGASQFDGQTWSGAGSPLPASSPNPQQEGFYAVSCVSATFCAAVGRTGRAVIYDGSDWSAGVSVDPSDRLRALSCPTTTFCAAADTAGDVLTFNGTAWSAPQSADPDGGGITGLSCPTTQWCVAVDAIGDSLTFDGRGWSAPAAVDPDGGGFEAISCPTATFCEATDAAGNSLTLSDGHWSATRSVDPSAILAAASCPAPGWCVAADEDGTGAVLVGDPARWTKPLVVDPAGGGVSGVSCAGRGTCVAVDRMGDALTLQAGHWSAPRPIDPTGGGLTSVSCPTPTSCLAVDQAGDAVQMADGTWSKPHAVDAGHALAAVSCPTVTFCAALDGDGRALTGRPNLTASAPTRPAPAGRDFYVDCADASGGNGTRTHPWNNLHGPDTTVFGPGDRLLLARGTSCAGTVHPLGSGAAGRPATISAYGHGARPVIAGGNRPEAVLLSDQQHWVVENLRTVGGTVWGISISGSSSAPGGPLVLDGITLRNDVVRAVHGVATTKRTGLIGVIQHGDQRFKDVTIAHCVAYGTREWSGIQVEAGIFQVAQGSHVTVEDSVVHHVGGDGIVIGEATAAVTQGNVAYDTGDIVTPTVAGNVGTPSAIWDFDCQHCLTQGNVDWGSRSSTHDGGDYDIDFGSQYQAVADNFGLGSDGYCVSVFSDSGGTEQSNVIRGNVCADNGRSASLAGQGAVFFSTFGADDMSGVAISGNVVVWDPAASAPVFGTTGGVFVGDRPDTVSGNVVAAADPDFVDGAAPVAFDHNHYLSTAPAVTPTWTYGGTTYDTFAAYQAGSGQDAHSTFATAPAKAPGRVPSLSPALEQELRTAGQLHLVLRRLASARQALAS
ncbi:MAG TPA: right-handed parallel beta-helix repeat-containing protein [Acidimicrobiales bacterium]|nr:right-handed parallel beta-helix repeat-containing protein [Acidimicrobiales bacterium]